MTVRPLKASDIPFLEEFARLSGYPYPDLDHSHIEAICVVADSNDRPIMAATAKRLVELYLFADPNQHPAVKLDALKLLHMGLAAQLRTKGYNSAEAFLPPAIDRIFGGRLMRTFGWVRNWVSYCVKF